MNERYVSHGGHNHYHHYNCCSLSVFSNDTSRLFVCDLLVIIIPMSPFGLSMIDNHPFYLLFFCLFFCLLTNQIDHNDNDDDDDFFL